ncbi:Pentatricopeptide repeat (PPR) superfamily protein [Thalictrum thalictroides]|uniref:Pentatricopeptide repeat (PPR) superfamily protein n=1 Tax=Thalictrum thalictroides TaxID=46969 RepID=A0A7J6VZ56_THATH|nr:Pentatricopeptide repeat (PPR) superfamily protein [Thalictrum thalictroides]
MAIASSCIRKPRRGNTLSLCYLPIQSLLPFLSLSNPYLKHPFSSSAQNSSSLVEQVLTAILKNRSFDTDLPVSSVYGPKWTVDTVCEVLRSIPRFFFQSNRSIGRQKGFRHRAPLKQRDIQKESNDLGKGIRVHGPAGYRDPLKVNLGLDKALEFYYWIEKHFGFCHNEITCKEMALVLAKGNRLNALWEFLREMARRKGDGKLVTTSTVTCLIKVLGEEGLVNEALAAFYRMKQLHCKPDVYAYNTIICALCRVGFFKKARYYCAVNEIDKAVEMMGRMKLANHGIPTTSSYTPIIHALCEAGRVLEARNFLVELVDGGSVPRDYTYRLVCEALNSAGEDSLSDELQRKIEDGMDLRCRQVMRVKPMISQRSS